MLHVFPGRTGWGGYNISFLSNKRFTLTYAFRKLIVFPPCVDSGFECAIGVTGRDDVFFILGVNSFVRDTVLGIKNFCRGDGVPPRARMAAFSISEFLFLSLKLSLGRRLFKDALPREDEGLDDSLNLA